MPARRPSSPTFTIYVLTVCTAWAAVPVAALWGLDWRWIPTAFVAAAALLIAGGIVDSWAHERAQKREFARQLDEAKGKPDFAAYFLPPTDEEREARRAQIAAEEEAWLGNTEQPR